MTTLIVSQSGYVAGNAKYGVYTSTAAATFGYAVVNQGTVKSGEYGVFLKHGGTVTNGRPDITTVVIDAPFGVAIEYGLGTVKNFATIETGGGADTAGVVLLNGGLVKNGAPTDSTALITGYDDGVVDSRAPATVANWGTITATATAMGVPFYGGVSLLDGGRVINNLGGLISGPHRRRSPQCTPGHGDKPGKHQGPITRSRAERRRPRRQWLGRRLHGPHRGSLRRDDRGRGGHGDQFRRHRRRQRGRGLSREWRQGSEHRLRAEPDNSTNSAFIGALVDAMR